MRALVLLGIALVACSTPAPGAGASDGGAQAIGVTRPDDGGAPAPADAGNAWAPDAGTADAGTSFDAGSAADAGPGDADAGDCDPDDGGTATLPPRTSPVIAENAQPGSRGWQLSNYSQNLGAYAHVRSAAPGETVSIHAAAAAATTGRWELWRLGYYQGNGGRRIAAGGPVSLGVWPKPVMDPATGAVSAGWPIAFAVQVPGSALTGFYLVKLISDEVGEAWAPLIVREPQPGAPILYPVSTNTYQAYNDWGGTSLYINARPDWPATHAYAVSFDRPYLRGNGSGELLEKDLDFITFAEGQGYDLAYVSDSDLDKTPHLVDGRRMLAVQGHSEYWTAGMRDAADRAVAHGVNVAFFAANNAYWQVRFADDTRQLLLGYKDAAALDPANATAPGKVTTRWRDAPVLRPENALIGEMYGTWIWTRAPISVTDPGSWLWTGAGVTSDSIIVGAFGDEVDRRMDNGHQPAGVTALADGLVEGYDGRFALGETTVYTAPSGAQVFSAGSITWSKSLAQAGVWDPRVQQLVANLFSRFAGSGVLGPAALKPLNLPHGAIAPTYAVKATVSTVTTALVQPAALAVAPNGDAIVADQSRIVRVTPLGVVTLLAGGEPGFADGVAASAQFDSPRGLAVAPNGNIYVSDTGNHRIRLISGSVVSTLAGSKQGFQDGGCFQALFSQPMGIALTATGTLLVADSWNLRVRAISPTCDVSTWAGTGLTGVHDAPGVTAQLNFPYSIAVLPSGDAVIAEPGSGVIRRVLAAPTHQVDQLAGQVGYEGWDDGPCWQAGVSETLAVAVRPNGDVLLADGATSRIRRFQAGAVDTLAGGQRGGIADGSGETAGFGWPRAIAVAPDGSILVADAKEHALRRITLP